MDIEAELRAQFIDLHRILQALRSQDIGPALGYVSASHVDASLTPFADGLPRTEPSCVIVVLRSSSIFIVLSTFVFF